MLLKHFIASVTLLVVGFCSSQDNGGAGLGEEQVLLSGNWKFNGIMVMGPIT